MSAGSRIEEVDANEHDSDPYEDIGDDIPDTIPPWLDFDHHHLPADDLDTRSSLSENKVADECLPLLLSGYGSNIPVNSHGLPHLRRKEHAAFLRNNLNRLPAPYVAMDASRPWMFYWVLAGLSFLGEDVSEYRERLIQTLQPLQNITGGFGGGHGQMSHAAGAYACVLALACVDGMEMIDRKAMWHYLGSIKHSNGGFLMAVGAEEDVRGAYCAMTVIALLNLPLNLPPDSPARKSGLKKFTDGLGEWISRCQTYEGGISGAPTNEAHGAYTFCALACLSIMDAPHISIPRYLDLSSLISWLAASQVSPEGGFRGRTNKLVDACYSHWSGVCWALLHAATSIPSSSPPSSSSFDSIWNRPAQIRYLLSCCQDTTRRGGMRDKPSMRADAYHTCYSLSGLSAAQNHYAYDTAAPTMGQDGRLIAAFNWAAQRPEATDMKAGCYDEEDRVGFVHPVFVLPMEAVKRARMRFEQQAWE